MASRNWRQANRTIDELWEALYVQDISEEERAAIMECLKVMYQIRTRNA